MAEFVGELEPLDQAVAQLLIVRLAAMPFQPFAQPRHRVHERADIERWRTGSLIHSAASFSASFAAFSSAAFASTSSTMCSTMSAPAIVWSVLPAR